MLSLENLLITYLHPLSISISQINNHFELIWFGKFKTPTWWVFVHWWDDETDFKKKKKAYRKRSSSKTSGKGNFIRFELQNEQSPLSAHKLQWPPNCMAQIHGWFLDLLFWLRGCSAFPEKQLAKWKALISNTAWEWFWNY